MRPSRDTRRALPALPPRRPQIRGGCGGGGALREGGARGSVERGGASEEERRCGARGAGDGQRRQQRGERGEARRDGRVGGGVAARPAENRRNPKSVLCLTASVVSLERNVRGPRRRRRLHAPGGGASVGEPVSAGGSGCNHHAQNRPRNNRRAGGGASRQQLPTAGGAREQLACVWRVCGVAAGPARSYPTVSAGSKRTQPAASASATARRVIHATGRTCRAARSRNAPRKFEGGRLLPPSRASDDKDAYSPSAQRGNARSGEEQTAKNRTVYLARNKGTQHEASVSVSSTKTTRWEACP